MEPVNEISLEGFKIVSGDFFCTVSRVSAPTMTVWDGSIGFSKQDLILLNSCENVIMQINAPEEDLPHVLISDGKYRESELRRAGVSREALDAFLGPGGPVLLCVLDSRGTLFWQRSGEIELAHRAAFPGVRP